MREVVLDTETTGLDPANGHRLVEIGCVELENFIPTGRIFHKYLNPQRDMPDDAFRIHGLSLEFLRDQPLFAAIADEFIGFIGDARLVIHNAEFDMKFINAELRKISQSAIPMARVLDTLQIARRKHPGASNSLDALCARYRIDNSRRTRHGALLDSEILAEVYIELTGGHQKSMVLDQALPASEISPFSLEQLVTRDAPSNLTQLEAKLHAEFAMELGTKAYWHLYYASGGNQLS